MNKESLCKYILAFVDLFLLLFSAVLVAFLVNQYGDLPLYLPQEQMQDRLIIHSLISLFGVSWFWLRLRHYTYRKPFWSELKEVIRTLFIIMIIELATLAFSKLYFSRYLWLFTWGFIFLVVPLARIAVKQMLIRSGIYIKETIIIGGGLNAFDAYQAISSESYLGLKVKYFISQQPCDDIKKLAIPIIDDSHNWERFVQKSDQFILALEENEVDERDDWVRKLSKKLYRSISIIPTLRGLPLYSTDMTFLFSYDVILLRINNNLAKRTSRVLKRLIDIILSLILITILLIPLFFIYCLIKKPIYAHWRVGKNGKNFRCFKFRSMVLNSDALLQEILENDPLAREEWESDFKLKNDPRITNIGKWLRKYSLDELPQLFNVLLGDMSLVGPRPITEEELKLYGENVDYYLMAKPGMTGLWQVSGRNNVDYETRVYFDAWYVKNWSLWNDFVILCKTPNVVLKKKGAY